MAAQAQACTQLCLTRLFLPPDGQGVIRTAQMSNENRAFLAAMFPGARLQPMAKAELLAELERGLSDHLLAEAVYGLMWRTPELSAHRVLSRGQAILFVALSVLFLAALCQIPGYAVRVLFGLLSAGFLASALFRAWLAFPRKARSTFSALARNDATLPLYTILVPLYREANIVPALARALRALDYPPEKLDIKLVVEADDGETQDAARALEPAFEIVAVPPGGPRTKPKACNYALGFARGEFLVIYDAEDRPEPDQLLKAVAAFRAATRRTACLQARLNFYNADVNWLTAMFALDYALWFEVLLPGLDRMGVPIPLGGTSNHFRTAMLRQIGGWDSFNVTEDADIGIRLSQLGFRVGMLDSTTFEECPARLAVWLRQRSRWLKGYMQTWLVHMRDPLMLLRRTGLRGFLAFQLFIGGGVIFALANPLLWVGFLAASLLDWSPWNSVFAAVPGASLLLTNLVLTHLAIAAPRRMGLRDLSPYGMTVIAYWALVSLAGYRGLWQLVTRPFYWEKTQHGATPE